MKITVQYQAQLKQAAGCANETVELPAPITVGELINFLAARKNAALAGMLLGTDGKPAPSNLIFIDRQLVRRDHVATISDGQTVLLASPIGGG